MAKLSVSTIDKDIGKRLQQRRKELKITVAKLSEDVGISPQQLARYERGENKINLEHFVKLTAKLNTPISWFFIEHDIAMLAITKNKFDAPQKSYFTKQNNDLDIRLLQHWQHLTIEQKRAFILFLDTLPLK